MALSRRKKIIIIVSAVALLGLIVIISVFASRKDEPEVTTIKIEVRPELRQTVTASGEVRPIQFVNMTSEVAGRIEEIFVKEGDLVTKGQPLVRLDPTQLQSNQQAQAAASQAAISDVQNARTQVLAAENNVAQAQQALTVAEASVASARQQLVSSQTNVDRAQVDLNTAQRELKRTTELVESGVASRSEYDAARDRLEQAQVSLRTAQANYETHRRPARAGERRRERVARQPAGGPTARPVQPARQGHTARPDHRHHRRRSVQGRNLRRRRTLYDAALDHRRHVYGQRRGQGGRDGNLESRSGPARQDQG
jgi:HlyD family secretion protein